MFQFVHICTSLVGFGVTWYIVSDSFAPRVPGGPPEKVPVLLGLGRDGVFRTHYRTKENLEQYPLATIKQWVCTRETFVFDFGSARDGHWGIMTRAGRTIAQILLGYNRLLSVRAQARRQGQQQTK